MPSAPERRTRARLCDHALLGKHARLGSHALGLVAVLGACARRGPDPVEHLDVSIPEPRSSSSASEPTPSMTQHATKGGPRPGEASLLALAGASTSAPLAVPVGREAELSIQLPNDWMRNDFYVGSFTVRSSDGNQDSLEIAPGAGSERTVLARLSPAAVGTAVVALCIGPKALADRSNAWELVTHCSKLVLEVGGSATPGVEMSRFGLPLEVVPLTSTGRTPRGESLAVLFYYGTGEAKQTDVFAQRPDGSLDRQITNDSGAAHFVLSQAGRWRVAFTVHEGDKVRIGELVFHVP